MNEGFKQILIQTGYYLVVLIIGFLIVGLLQKGFFWPFIRVKLSFGKFVMVKVRGLNRDYYRVGTIEEGDLIYFQKKYDRKIINILDRDSFYRSLGILWIDVDETKNCILKPDAKVVSGFDAIKMSNLIVRALTGPELEDNKTKMILAIGIFICVLIIVIGILVFRQGQQIQALSSQIQSTLSTVGKGVV